MTIVEFLLARIAEEENVARLAAARPEAAMNITRWHPTRVLAECAGKREIIELHGSLTYGNGDPAGDDVLGALALPYSHHPDCPSWVTA